MSWKPEPPPAADLSYEQYSGRACCWCGKALWRGTVSAGVSRGRQGAQVLDIEVYACPECAVVPTVSRPSPKTGGARPSAEGNRPQQEEHVTIALERAVGTTDPTTIVDPEVMNRLVRRVTTHHPEITDPGRHLRRHQLPA